MKMLLQIFRYLVGFLFIFSGLIKLNDPYGFSYKLKEYFEVFAADFGDFFHAFIPFSLSLALIICISEIVLGVAVLIRYRMKITSWALFLMILFFTFLTFYSAWFEKVKECGCFGDFISLTPWESFWKDVILLIMILFLFVFRNTFKDTLKNPKGDFLVVIAAISFGFGGYFSLAHLPYFDWRPYAIGKNIKTQMEPEEAPKFIYIMEKDGKQIEMETYPTDTNYKYVDYKVLNPEKSQPKILDYQIWNEEGDFTEYSLEGKVLFIILRNAGEVFEDKESRDAASAMGSYISKLEKAGIKPMLLTSSQTESLENFRHETQLPVPYYFMDDTQLKTMIRADFGFILLKDGTILGKWHSNDTPDANELINLAS